MTREEFNDIFAPALKVGDYIKIEYALSPECDTIAVVTNIQHQSIYSLWCEVIYVQDINTDDTDDTDVKIGDRFLLNIFNFHALYGVNNVTKL